MANLSAPSPSTRVPMVPIFSPPLSPFSKEFLIGSVEPLYTLQHFHERGYLCSGRPSCPLCKSGCGRKAYWWVAAWDDAGRTLLRLPHVAEWHDVLSHGHRVRLVRARKRGELLIQPHLFGEDEGGSNATPSAVENERLLALVLRIFGLTPSREMDLSSADDVAALGGMIDAACLLVAQRFAKSRR